MPRENGSPRTNLPRRVFTNPAYWIAFGFGSGLAPRAPGTAGTLVGMLLFYPLAHTGAIIYVTVVVGVLLGGIFICDHVAASLGSEDPAGIVLDEIVGIWIALFMVPVAWPWVLAGFILFRIFDVWKPWPVGLLDSLGGGVGIMLDDVTAGLYTLALLQTARWFLPGSGAG